MKVHVLSGHVSCLLACHPDSRRRAAILSLAASGLTLVGYVMYCLRRLHITRLAVTLPELSEQLDGTRIAFLTDFHLGRIGTSSRVVGRALDVATDFDANLTILTGDYFDAPHTQRDEQLLMRLENHERVIAVLGNHDYARGRAHLARTLAVLDAAGAVVLRNEAVEVPFQDSSVWVVGLDDPFTLRSDITKARALVPRDGPPILIAAHAPVLSALGDLSDVALVFCGHTHGGQIRILPSGDIPGKRLLRWLVGEHGPRRDPDLFRGVHQIDTATIVISDGIGVSLLPVRFRTRPQLVLLTLRRRR